MALISYTTGICALPDIYAVALGLTPSRLCVYIKQSTHACGITITYISSVDILEGLVWSHY